MGVEGEGKRKWTVPQIGSERAGLPPLPRSHRRGSVQLSWHYGARQSAEPDSWEPARFAQLQQEAKSKSQSASLQTPRHLSAGSERCNRITSHAYLFLWIQGGIFGSFKARHGENKANPFQNK